ncbi:DUF6492 family protein [Cohnella sp. GCM10027633]|uniref:DUF6492 family protein n=1 Tax=unclassified Cohnella TaxID=2636738 RepID=UPI003630B616
MVIDVVIPAIDKDLGTLPYVIDSARKHVAHPIGRIAVVAPDSRGIRAVCKRKGCAFVHERNVLPMRKSDISYRSSRWERSGWLYQQLLKLGSSSIVKRRRYLVMDADTVLVRRHRFLENGKPIFYCRGWSQPEYFVTYRKLIGRPASRPRSFVTHYMMFDQSKLGPLKRKIEARHGKSWYKAIIGSIDRRKQFGFSEYETYGNYVYGASRGAVRLKSAMNKSLHTDPSKLSGDAWRKLAKKYRSVSFHKRKGYARGGRK